MVLGLRKKIIFFFRFLILNFYTKPLNILRLLKDKKFYLSESYFPDKKAKSTWRNFFIQVLEIIRYGYPNEYFFMYGWDVKNKEERDKYVNFREFWNRSVFLNTKDMFNSSIGIFRNKLYFDIFTRAINLSTPRIIVYFSQNKLYSIEDGFKEISFENLSERGDRMLFCKEMSGECGKGIFILEIKDGEYYCNGNNITIEQINSKIKDAEYIFQDVVVQHSKMAELYSNSINTIRLVTVRSLKDNNIYVMPSILRVGANGSFVDNTSQGGIAVGVNLITGQLNQYGFYKPQFGTKVEKHPNTGIVFSEFQIPYFEKVKEQAIFFHSMLKDIHSIGWDIAIGENGPIFIEGNDNWEINGPQVGNYGLREEFEKYFFE